MPSVHANDIAIEYESFGADDAEPMLLISGLGMQMIRWDVRFCEGLAARGYRVLRFDNRDAGLSTHFDDAPVPDLASVAETVGRGEPAAVPYTLHDMADDGVSLLDALAIERAHIVGRSMGGMIAQLIASKHPRRTLSLASLMSTSGNPDLPPPSPEVMSLLRQRPPHPSEDEAGFLAHSVAFARMIGSPGYPSNEAEVRTRALVELRRAYDPRGAARQIAAMAATVDCRSRLARITAPTVVVHGSDDPLMPPAGARDTAANIANAELLIIEGMGHDLPPALHGRVIAAVVGNARRVTPPSMF